METVQETKYFHASDARIAIGKLLIPGGPNGPKKHTIRCKGRADRIYVYSATDDSARQHAMYATHGRFVYEVEVIGEVVEDPDPSDGRAFMVTYAKVVRKLPFV
jgi:hypothetical protein